ncbi:hypothetical protein M3Y95_00324000 [Aphelenchoides besseyi]|nr:hypothetical protein M3Y95_00324000 [Aphelenchoides besseyi]
MEGQYEPIGNLGGEAPPAHAPSSRSRRLEPQTPTDIRSRVDDNQYEIPNFAGVQTPPPHPTAVQSTPMIGKPVVMVPSKRARKTVVRVEEDMNVQTLPPPVLPPQLSAVNLQISEAVEGATIETPPNQQSEADPTKPEGIKEGDRTKKKKSVCDKSYTRCQCFEKNSQRQLITLRKNL